MTGMANFPLACGAATTGSRGGIAPVEKSCGSNGLNNGAGAPRKHRDDSIHRAPQQDLSHSETVSAPRWYAPRLSAPFVAQILGQVLAQAEPDTNGARAAYEAAVMRTTGGIYDRRI
jgi:hypothetical protein